MDLGPIKQFLSQHNLLEFDASINTYLKELKADAVAQNIETLVNKIWCLEASVVYSTHISVPLILLRMVSTLMYGKPMIPLISDLAL